MLKIVREVDLNQGSLNAVSISKSNSILFVATQTGVIMTIMLPMMYKIVFKEFKIHSDAITKVYHLFLYNEKL